MRQVLLERHFPDKDLRSQPVDRILTSLASRLIAVEGEQHPAFGTDGCDNEPFLLLTHRAAHERDNVLSAALPELEDREESLDNKALN